MERATDEIILAQLTSGFPLGEANRTWHVVESQGRAKFSYYLSSIRRQIQLSLLLRRAFHNSGTIPVRQMLVHPPHFINGETKEEDEGLIFRGHGNQELKLPLCVFSTSRKIRPLGPDPIPVKSRGAFPLLQWALDQALHDSSESTKGEGERERDRSLKLRSSWLSQLSVWPLGHSSLKSSELVFDQTSRKAGTQYSPTFRAFRL